VTETMLRYFIEKVIGHSFVFRPRIMICVPSGLCQLEVTCTLSNSTVECTSL
ncbi:MAG: rod shape-determining protein, partial [Prevotella sp.]|nr:rod shape-determining protein [Prevotella sp.]